MCMADQPPKSTPIILITKHSWFNCPKWSETRDFTEKIWNGENDERETRKKL